MIFSLGRSKINMYPNLCFLEDDEGLASSVSSLHVNHHCGAFFLFRLPSASDATVQSSACSRAAWARANRLFLSSALICAPNYETLIHFMVSTIVYVWYSVSGCRKDSPQKVSYHNPNCCVSQPAHNALDLNPDTKLERERDTEKVREDCCEAWEWEWEEKRSLPSPRLPPSFPSSPSLSLPAN